MSVEFGPIDYRADAVPASYKCSKCAAHGCKLWRQYQTVADQADLLCGECALHDQKKQGPLDRFGCRPCDVVDGQRTDQIGWLVPAVPTKEGDTFWGYMSTPERGVRWWLTLPTSPERAP